MASICIIKAYTPEESFGLHLADAYKKGAIEGGHKVQEINIYDLNFDPFAYTFSSLSSVTLEPDMQQVIHEILRCDHLVIFVPVYKLYVPSVLQSFFQQIFRTDYYGKPLAAIWGDIPFLHLKTARIISTLDKDSWLEFQKDRNARFHPLKKSVLEFMGFQKVRTTTVPPAYDDKESDYVKKWINKIAALGNHSF